MLGCILQLKYWHQYLQHLLDKYYAFKLISLLIFQTIDSDVLICVLYASNQEVLTVSKLVIYDVVKALMFVATTFILAW
jgi:hypothetical protein